MKHKFFYANGELRLPIPTEALEACGHPGPCDQDVREWRERLGFTVPREQAIKFLREYGAWDAEELAAKSDESLAEIVLWLAAGDYADGQEFLGLIY